VEKEHLRNRAGTILDSMCHQGRVVLILLAYGLLVVVMTWPLAARLATHIPAGTGGDVWVHQWTLEWLKRSLAEGRDPFYTDLLFHPNGVSLTSHNIAWLNFALWLPLQAILGNQVAYGLTYVGFFTLNGLAMYLLAREWTGSPLAAFIGGLVYGFWPYVMSQFGHPNMIVVSWLPLALLYLRRAMDGGRKRDPMLAALFLALIGISRWQLLIVAGVTLGLYLLYKCLADAAWRTWRALARLALIGLLAGILMAPLATPVVVGQLTRTYRDDVLVGDPAERNTDLLAYLLPNQALYLWGDVVPWLPENLRFATAPVEFIGYTTLALALYGVVKNWPAARFWVLVAGVHVSLALGSQLRVGSRLYPQVPMPYRLIEDWFLVRILRYPRRFNVFLGLPLGMLAALGVAALLRQGSRGYKSTLLTVVAGVLILGESCIVPYRVIRPVTPTWYRQLAQEAGHFAVLDLPMHPRLYDKWYMFYQMTHGKPLVEGHVSRTTREAFAFLESTALLSRLRRDNVMDPALADVTHQLRPLAEADVRYLILHKRFASPQRLASWRDWLTFEPYYEDADLVVYRTAPHLGRDFTLAHRMADEIGLIRVTFGPQETTQAGSIRVVAGWASSGVPDRDHGVCLKLVDAGGQVAQAGCQALLPSWPTLQWGIDEVARGDYKLRVDPSLVAGSYTLTMSLADDPTGVEAGKTLVLGTVQVRALPYTYEAPGQARTFHARWGDAVLLPAYGFQERDGSLRLTLYWQAIQKMGVSYKVFVHLVDPATGAIVVQDDAVPRRSTYPTDGWDPGEVVEDAVVLPLGSVLAGRYRLLVGLYDPATGERLPAYSTQGERYPDDAVPLADVQR
jgi:hypothetical protein